MDDAVDVRHMFEDVEDRRCIGRRFLVAFDDVSFDVADDDIIFDLILM